MKHRTAKAKRQGNRQISPGRCRKYPNRNERGALRRVLDLVLGVSLVFVVWLAAFLPDNNEN
ncbi:MAG: hypothetical protein L0Y58_16670 [Verrucomicrobia subdivision 3 bacterium]|nr:hypothetical protein [Limisphaerales bacterium]